MEEKPIKPNKELEEIQQQRDEYLAGWQRAAADLINYKKEDGERMQFMKECVVENLIAKLLPIVDNLEIAESNIPEDLKPNEYVKGLLRLKFQLQDFLKSQEVLPIEAEGMMFDPVVHEALEEVHEEGLDPGKVVEVLEKGYMFKGKLLRPAKVKVAK